MNMRLFYSDYKTPFPSIQDLVETVIVLNCKQVSFLIEQDLHLNIAITSLIWLTMLESDNLKKFFVGSKYLLFFFSKVFCCNKNFLFLRRLVKAVVYPFLPHKPTASTLTICLNCKALREDE